LTVREYEYGGGTPMTFPITEHVTRTSRHTTFSLASGAEDAPLIIFVHGWPELSISWRHQLPCFAALGFRAIAPDMRGYGRSSIYLRHEDYVLEQSVKDMIELLDSLGAQQAIWVGHDWGSPVAWSVASHHPDRCRGVVNLCVPYFAKGLTLANLVAQVDRSIYPDADYPYGQWDYMRFYEESFDEARSGFEADIPGIVRLLFRAGSPEGDGKPAFTAQVRKLGKWFPGGMPNLPLDTTVINQEDHSKYAAALQRNGFFGPDSWYMNHDRNGEFAKLAVNHGRLAMPVLFLHGAYDYVCETVTSRLAEPMRKDCERLSEAVVHSGHWMAQEKPTSVNAAIARWLAREFPEIWRI
jgi:pimeloyl-ACP methyl ester carboxylesterase